MDELTPTERLPVADEPSELEQLASAPEAAAEEQETDPSRSPTTGWYPLTAPLALVVGITLALVAGLIVDLPATLLFGAKVTSKNTSPGLTIVDTIVQDVAFVLAAVYCAQLGGRVVRSWQFGLRRPGKGWSTGVGGVLLLLVAFIVLSVIWSEAVNPEKEKLLETLGSNEGTALLLASAVLTCVVAPICEEMLFRGYIFTALRNWKGTWPAAVITGILFGGVHATSAPVLDLVPLAALGFGLCMLYRYTGSLYPCMAAHSLNNSLAFSSLENWSWQLPVLMVGSLLGIAALVVVFRRVGLIAPSSPFARAEA